MPDIAMLAAELGEEGDELVGLLGALSPEDWERGTPAPGWDVSAQIAHLALVEERALTSIADPEAYSLLRSRDVTEGLLGTATESYRQLPPDRLLAVFLDVRARFTDAAKAAEPTTRIAWYGPDMSLASMITARLMETWAHGQDIRDAFGQPPCVSARLRHIARLGVATRAFSFSIRKLPAPTEPVAVSLEAPDGKTWEYGEERAQHQVSGPALDFCLVVTQRRHPADTSLVATPGPASDWLSIAQAFAGAPGQGRLPGQFIQQGGSRPAGVSQ
jgi:uncharacterized protein (TIGR03084 family)